MAAENILLVAILEQSEKTFLAGQEDNAVPGVYRSWLTIVRTHSSSIALLSSDHRSPLQTIGSRSTRPKLNPRGAIFLSVLPTEIRNV